VRINFPAVFTAREVLMARLEEKLKTALFEGLTDDDVDRFFDLTSLQTFKDEAVIIEEGDVGDRMFVVASGEVRVEKATIDMKQEVLAILGPGECFGELSLVDRMPRSATVRAKGETSVYVFSQSDLDAFFDVNPDIHRKVLQNLAKITSQRLRWLDDTLVQSVYDSIILVDTSCIIIQWKRITEDRRSLEGQIQPEHAPGNDLFKVVPHLGEGIRKKIMQVISSGEIAILQLDYELSPGRPVYFEVTVAPYMNGEVAAGAILALRDITETKALEAQLIQAEKLAMAGQMSAEIGHELNNYLAVISGHTDLLLDNKDLQGFARANKSLQAISDQIRKVERFTAGLMDLGMLRSKHEKTDLNQLVEKLVQVIQGQSRFRQTEFVLKADPDLPDLEIDPGQIQQVLLNLYANASDAMGKGRIITRTRFVEDGQRVTLTVEDNGPGMPDEVKERIFDTGFTTKSTGHGFGLAVCSRIIENHQGRIEVESHPGKGTLFTLTFKLD
jgi:signal transduction histidine kinase